MGAGASTAVSAAVKAASAKELETSLETLDQAGVLKLEAALEGRRRERICTGPTAWLTSNGFGSDTQWVKFIQNTLKRRKVLQAEDESESVSREHLVSRYSDEIKKLKVTYINDASFHRDENKMNEARVNKAWFWWDNGLQDMMGVPKENVTMIQILTKPWLFNRAARVANHDAQEPNVANLDPEDEKRYFEALQHTQAAYDALKEDPPQVGAGQAGAGLPGCPAGGLSCADELAKISAELNDKYHEALDTWCTKYFDEADIVCGQGGEVVMLNMAWACNQRASSRLVTAVRQNHTVYCGLSASTMVTAASMEMTGEIQPGWIEAFAVDGKYLVRNKHFKMEDVMDGEGTACNVVGTLPMFESPWAIRPHYKDSWMQKVLEKNLIAEKEFEKETGIDVDDSLVADSKNGVKVALKLLNFISAAGSDQDHPIFVPMHDGVAVEINFHNFPYKEVFTARD